MAPGEANAKDFESESPKRFATNGESPRKQYEQFELRSSPGKGEGAFATRDIEAGTTLFEEYPLMTIEKPNALVKERDIVEAYQRLSLEDKQVFDQCRHQPDHKLGCKCKSGIFDASMHVQSEESYPSMFPLASSFNHSCQPNIVIFEALSQDHRVGRTVKDIKKGEELTFSYNIEFPFLTTQQRQERLQQKQKIKCMCDHCALPREQLLISDMRRFLLGQLYVWLDRPFAETMPAVHFQNKRDPFLYAKGVYHLLFAMMLEAEDIVWSQHTHMAYAALPWHCLDLAFHDGVSHLPKSTAQDVKKWMKKSAHNIQLQYGDIDTEADLAWLSLRKMMKYVHGDGKLDWEGLLRISARNVKNGGQPMLTCPCPSCTKRHALCMEIV